MYNLSRRNFPGVAAIACAIFLVGPVAASEVASPISGKRVALSGYDPVAYFTKGRPEKGSRDFWFAFDDVVYLFGSGEHRAMFAAEPTRYAPQYDGYCTMYLALSGKKLEPNPESWAIHQGKLYVFGKTMGPDKFRADPAAIIGKANTAWPTVRKDSEECRFVDPAPNAWTVDCKAR